MSLRFAFFFFALVTLSSALPILTPFSVDFAPVAFHTGIVPGIIPAAQPPQNVAHPAVVENAIAESQLPQELVNPFYKNPAIAAGLAKESWFSNNEFPVHHREADKIPRSEIYKIVSRIQSVQRK